MIDGVTSLLRNVHCQELQRIDTHERRQHSAAGNFDDVVRFILRNLSRRISYDNIESLLAVQLSQCSQISFEVLVIWDDVNHWIPLVVCDQRNRSVLHLSRRVAFRVHIGQLLDFESPLLRNGCSEASAENQG